MKNLKQFALILAIAAIAFGCKKDDDNNPDNANNYYTYRDAKMTIGGATYFNQAVVGNNVLSIVLESTETSKRVQLFFYKSATSIPIGTFTYKDNSSATYSPANNFSGGSIVLDIGSSAEIRGGTVAISKEGDTYSISVSNATTANGTLTAIYHGKITLQ